MEIFKQKEEYIFIDEGWKKIIEIGIEPFIYRIERFNLYELNTKLNPIKEFLIVYDIIFQMCIQREPYNYSDRIYNLYVEVFFKCFTNKFLPSLKRKREKSDVDFLIEFTQRYQQNQYIIVGMQRMFCYLDRFYATINKKLLNMKEFSFILFKKIVFDYFKDEIRVILIKFIRIERERSQLNKKLIRKSILVFVKLGNCLRKTNNLF